jgi:hypothetical protein
MGRTGQHRREGHGGSVGSPNGGSVGGANGGPNGGPNGRANRDRRDSRDTHAGPDGGWLDADAGRLVRPYTVSNGRTQPTVALELLSMVQATGRVVPANLTPEHALAMDLSQAPVTVAEIGSYLRLPVAVAKILLSDLIDQGAVTARPPDPAADPADRDILQRVLDGLHRRLLQ